MPGFEVISRFLEELISFYCLFEAWNHVRTGVAFCKGTLFHPLTSFDFWTMEYVALAIFSHEWCSVFMFPITKPVGVFSRRWMSWESLRKSRPSHDDFQPIGFWFVGKIDSLGEAWHRGWRFCVFPHERSWFWKSEPILSASKTIHHKMV